jgi:hypothetical protein
MNEWCGRSESVDIEKSLQSLMERHLESFLGVRFLASEYVAGRAHKAAFTGENRQVLRAPIARRGNDSRTLTFSA